jgi:hypothetical protein
LLGGGVTRFCDTHAIHDFGERALNCVRLEVSWALIAGKRDRRCRRARVGIGFEVVDREKGDEMREEGVRRLRDAGVRHRGWMQRERRREARVAVDARSREKRVTRDETT